MGIEQLLNVHRSEPTTYNQNSPDVQFTETQYRVENPDGTVTEIDYYHRGYYVVRWQGKEQSPNDFLTRAQMLVDQFKEDETTNPYEGKPLGLRVIQRGSQNESEWGERDLEVFSPQADLDTGNVEAAIYKTPWGDLYWWDIEGHSTNRGIVTHVNSPDLLTNLVAETSSEIDKKALVEVLKEVGDAMRSSVAT